ncbi:Zn-dependent exopeptidase [Lentinula aff. detonsa]|uniref:Zn-dependent exopeptidase n=1 Tax=Lentinula aff. detonsa TaxID=2804958 RepID=A0AA38K8W5_9AGAR|nr:Zn-dependent exopeptidase [Lentinula aff. detonsa]
MSSEKTRSAFGGVLTKADGLPIANPVKAATPQNRRRPLFYRFLACYALLYSLFVAMKAIQGFGPHSLFNEDNPKGHFKKPLMGEAAEKYFLEVPNEESCIQASRQYTAEPHPAGSDRDLQTAKDFLTLLQNELDIKTPSETPIFPAGSLKSRHATLMIPKAHAPYAWIDTYYPVMNTPLERNLQTLDADGKVLWEADLEEHAEPEDPEAHKYSDSVPTFHGLSKGADVSGKLIYANYGLVEDYDALVGQGVNLTGAIVLTRYGGNFRGIKVQKAQELGAAGVLIYSDVRDDGTVTIENGYKPYPHGPARNPKAVQRGSVQFLSMYPGDPTTPGTPAYENATRTEGLNKPQIPSLPISQENGEKLLKLAKDGWNGTVRLNNQVDEKVMPIWNTMAIIPGYIKDEVVMLGNHRDAWVMGAADPTSGTASIHETIRGLGALLKKGWKPLRSILIASWDAEEYGLIGSTEWGEDFTEFVDKYVVAYLNLDGAASGSRFQVGASPSLAHLVYGAALAVPHPTEEGKNLWDATHDTGKYFGDMQDVNIRLNAEAVAVHEASLNARDNLGVGVLGSGSDFTIFLQRIGVASMNHGFTSTMTDAVYHYHSVYDSERWEEMYADPGFYRHVAVAKHLGLVTLRLTGSIVLPLNTTHYAYELESYLDKVEDQAIAHSTDVNVDLSPLRNSIHSLQAASQALDYEKFVSERELKKILKKWHKKGSKLRKLRRKARKAYCKMLKKVFGKECHHHSKELSPKIQQEEDSQSQETDADAHVQVDLHSEDTRRLHPRSHPHSQRGENRKERSEMIHGFALHSGFEAPFQSPYSDEHTCGKPLNRPHFPMPKIYKAIKRVRAVNQKLIAFERGFISEDGLPSREWYKHLGVAPGRWLGYGATTLPALTESITLDKNSTLAKYEAERLRRLVDKLVETIRV